MTDEQDPIEAEDAPETGAKPFDQADYTTRDEEADEVVAVVSTSLIDPEDEEDNES